MKTGLFGLKSTFVPTREAQVTGDDQVRVPFQKDQVKNAPTIDADGQLSPEQERELWELLRRGIVGRRSRECGYDA